MQWREIYFGHAALLGSVRCGTVTAESLASSRRSLLRQLRDFCRHRATTMGSASAAAPPSSKDQPPAVALLRLAVGVAGSLSTSSSFTRTLHDPTEALQTLLAALRCALAELGAEAGTATSSPPPAALGGSQSLPDEIARTLAELGRAAERWEASGANDACNQCMQPDRREASGASGHGHGATRLEDESHDDVDVDEDVEEDVDEVLLLAPEPGTVVTETVFPPPAKRARTVAGLPSVVAHPPPAAVPSSKRPRRREGLNSWQPTLWICGGTAALLVLAGGGPSAGIDALCRALCLSGACLPGAVTDAGRARADDAVLVPVALTVDLPAAPNVPRVDERMKALAWAVYVHAHCIGRVALHSHSAAAAAAAAAAAIPAIEPAASIGGAAAVAAIAASTATAANDFVLACQCDRARSALLLLLGRAADARAALLDAPSRALVEGPVHATTCAVVHASCGEPMEALEALQRAISLGGSDGAVGAWLLYNLRRCMQVLTTAPSPLSPQVRSARGFCTTYSHTMTARPRTRRPPPHSVTRRDGWQSSCARQTLREPVAIRPPHASP